MPISFPNICSTSCRFQNCPASLTSLSEGVPNCARHLPFPTSSPSCHVTAPFPDKAPGVIVSLIFITRIQQIINLVSPSFLSHLPILTLAGLRQTLAGSREQLPRVHRWPGAEVFHLRSSSSPQSSCRGSLLPDHMVFELVVVRQTRGNSSFNKIAASFSPVSGLLEQSTFTRWLQAVGRLPVPWACPPWCGPEDSRCVPRGCHHFHQWEVRKGPWNWRPAATFSRSTTQRSLLTPLWPSRATEERGDLIDSRGPVRR